MQPAIVPLVVSTDHLPERERFNAWRETFALKLARVDPITRDPTRFRSVIRALPLGRVSLAHTHIAPVTLMRTRELLRDGDDDLALVVCAAGRFSARFDDRSATLKPGSATLFTNGCVGGVSNDVGGATYTLRLPRSLLRESIGTAEPPVLRLFRGSEPALQLLSIFVRGLIDHDAGLSHDAARLAGQQIAELIANLLDPTCELVREQRFGGLKTARLQSILHVIERELCEPALDADRVGAKLGLSRRYVHHLLAEAGTTLSEVLRQKRLQRARHMLQEPRRIVDVAYAVGFNDLSTFNRAFRQHFGCTPSDLRRRNGAGAPGGD
jgi:AraC-like DNA-binding protein